MKEKASAIKVEDVRNAVNMKSNTFNTYRTRLLDSGVVDGKQYGYLSIKLPRFSNILATRGNI